MEDEINFQQRDMTFQVLSDYQPDLAGEIDDFKINFENIKPQWGEVTLLDSNRMNIGIFETIVKQKKPVSFVVGDFEAVVYFYEDYESCVIENDHGNDSAARRYSWILYSKLN